MDLAMLTALVQGQLAGVAGLRQAERDTRDAISGLGIEQMAQALFPGVDLALLKANQDLPNYLQQGVARYVRALTRGELNWEWDLEGDPPEQGNPGVWLTPRGRDLVQDATTDALVAGKFAFFPNVGQDGKLRVTTLTGFLWPIHEPGDVSDVQAVLQVTSGMVKGKLRYQVRRYSAGLLEVFSDLEDWTKYSDATSVPYPQRHAPDRLPLAFRVVGRDANREPEGLAQTAMPAFRRYVKFAILLAFIATRGGFETRVVKSDFYARLAENSPNHPLLADLKKDGPNVVKLMDAAGSYDRLDPVKLAEFREQEAVARADVRDALNMPDTGGDLSGEALAEKREAYTETLGGLAGSVRDALTEAHDLAALLRPTELRRGWRVTLTPHITRDVEAARTALREDYKAGGLPLSAYLSGLQSLGVSQVTDAHVEAAEAREAADLVPTPPGSNP